MSYILLKLHNYSELDYLLNGLLFILAKVDFSPTGHKRVVFPICPLAQFCTWALNFFIKYFQRAFLNWAQWCGGLIGEAKQSKITEYTIMVSLLVLFIVALQFICQYFCQHHQWLLKFIQSVYKISMLYFISTEDKSNWIDQLMENYFP